MSLLFALAACTSIDAGPAPAPVAVAPVPAAPPPAPADPIPTRSGKGYSDHWLVILSSKKELAHLPDGAKALLAEPPPIEADLARLSSTEFKALQPCFEIVVAKAFSDRKEAVAYSKQLTALGIDNYAKHAGRWVGEQPRVDAYCRGERTDSELTCPSGAVLAESHAGEHFLRIDLDPAVSGPALASAPALKSISETAWIAPLPAKSLGSHSVGDTWVTSAATGPTLTCRIWRFVAATRGTPHFGWYEGERAEPGCGEPIVMAELTCDGADDIVLASRSPFEKAQPGGEISDDESDARTAIEVADAEARWNAYRQSAHDQAGPEPVTEAYTFERLTAGGRVLVAIRGRWTTGEGNAECGGTDVDTQAWVLVDPAKRAIVAGPIDAYGMMQVVPFDLGSDGAWEVWARDWNGTARILDGDRALCTNDLPYCDCPC